MWRFIPQSFRLVIQELAAVLQLMTLAIKTEFDTTGSEFHVTLGREQLPAGIVDRLELLRQLASAGGVADLTLAPRTGVVRTQKNQRG